MKNELTPQQQMVKDFYSLPMLIVVLCGMAALLTIMGFMGAEMWLRM